MFIVFNAVQMVRGQVFQFTLNEFLRASAMLKHVTDIGWTSVCPSVTRCHCIKTAEYIVMLSSPHDSRFILVCVYQDLREIPTGSPPAGALNTGGV